MKLQVKCPVLVARLQMTEISTKITLILFASFFNEFILHILPLILRQQYAIIDWWPASRRLDGGRSACMAANRKLSFTGLCFCERKTSPHDLYPFFFSSHQLEWMLKCGRWILTSVRINCHEETDFGIANQHFEQWDQK